MYYIIERFDNMQKSNLYEIRARTTTEKQIFRYSLSYFFLTIHMLNCDDDEDEDDNDAEDKQQNKK